MAEVAVGPIRGRGLRTQTITEVRIVSYSQIQSPPKPRVPPRWPINTRLIEIARSPSGESSSRLQSVQNSTNCSFRLPKPGSSRGTGGADKLVCLGFSGATAEHRAVNSRQWSIHLKSQKSPDSKKRCVAQQRTGALNVCRSVFRFSGLSVYDLDLRLWSNSTA